ncbi:outer membrane protein assembly factor BamD [Candidatus Pelagibacter sp.]|nr:outer membrane protein assembly factor BamD [Candidatus Pelagibacter sp.]
MNILVKFIFIVIFILFNACSKNEKQVSVLENKEINMLMIDAYKDGVKALEEGDALFAAKKFNEAELLFPQSVWASKSVLMAAYSYYSQDYYEDAKFELERFIKSYPEDKRLPYAHFLLAMCYYEEIVDEKKDLEPLLKARSEFNFIIKNYPNTDFALDSTYKLDLINDILASKEIYLGRYYLKKEKWVASINRFKKVVEDYDTTVYIDEAIHRLVEINYRIGLIDESKKYASLLGYNYQSSKWYEASYSIFNKNYESPIKKINKKKRNFIIRKFKSLFD